MTTPKTTMSKTFIPDTDTTPQSQIGASLDALAKTIEDRRNADESCYTYRLLQGKLDDLLKKIVEESLEVSLAAKETQMLDAYAADEALPDASIDHMRYEAADVVYHLLVLLARFDIPIDEFAAELNNRMTEGERPAGAVLLKEEYVRRGK